MTYSLRIERFHSADPVFHADVHRLCRVGDTPLRLWVERFLFSMRHGADLSENTIRHYGHDLELFLRYLNRYHPSVTTPQKVTASIVRRYLKHTVGVRGNSPASNRRRLASLKKFFRHLRQRGVVDADPTARVQMEKFVRRPPTRLTLNEAARILEASKTTSFPHRDHAIFQLFLTCGCTLSELIALDLDDYDREEGTITLVGRRGQRRTVLLSNSCQNALDEYLEHRAKAPADRALFLNRQGMRLTKGAIYHAFRYILRRARIDRPGVTIHSLRHTCFALLWEAGLSLIVLHQIAGHGSIATTRAYIRTGRRSGRPASKPMPTRMLFPLDE